MRVMLANMLPWAEFRRTYGQPIATRELVKRRIGRLAGADRRLRRPGRLGLVADRPGLSRRDGVHHRQDLRQRGAEGSGHRAVHEDARRPVVPARPPVRRQRPRVPGPVHLRRRRRDARHGVLQVAGQGARQAVLRADRQGAAAARHQDASTRSTRSTSGSCGSELGGYAQWSLGPASSWPRDRQPVAGMDPRLAEHVAFRPGAVPAASPPRSAARWASISSSWPTASAAWPSCRSGCRTRS